MLGNIGFRHASLCSKFNSVSVRIIIVIVIVLDNESLTNAREYGQGIVIVTVLDNDHDITTHESAPSTWGCNQTK